MSAVGNPYDHAKAEAFFKTLKREIVESQVTKRLVRAVAGGREGVADLDAVVRDDDAIDEQFDQ